ncbi:hypothetical protein DV495_003432 [Geotrichum candidum]|uniref:Uncharacterized protein n=1 Tax=Geotrichum candidum TaxID=1173061 RepID=A0A0J9XBJ5_GEOCN|nr:hypothetical protein DV452_005184 [Geotrichum candidum]KAI9209945.1 hypothetical protein DS838_005172 [Geotrichum bryndzae]KAF5126553.1 hypothetical protein DV495_003432 [Geotrichum candidum]KAF7497854.1 hypothetical protein DV113_004094 [Geotrichum candidum]KAI8134241.1 hypothetical protein DUD61_002059 [Geotrichum candidum]
MVTINRVIFASAIAAIVNAIPIAEARPIAFANAQPITNNAPGPHGDGYANRTIILARDTSEGNNLTKREIPESYNVTKRAISEDFNITKRADTVVIPDLGTLLSQGSSVLEDALQTLLNGGISSDGSQLVTLLTNVNSYLSQVETSLKNYVPATGVGSEIQDSIVKTGLQSLVFALSTFVGILATITSQGINNPQIPALIKELYSHIEAITNAGGKFSLLGTLGDIVQYILSVVSNILKFI